MKFHFPIDPRGGATRACSLLALAPPLPALATACARLVTPELRLVGESCRPRQPTHAQDSGRDGHTPVTERAERLERGERRREAEPPYDCQQRRPHILTHTHATDAHTSTRQSTSIPVPHFLPSSPLHHGLVAQHAGRLHSAKSDSREKQDGRIRFGCEWIGLLRVQ